MIGQRGSHSGGWRLVRAEDRAVQRIDQPSVAWEPGVDVDLHAVVFPSIRLHHKPPNAGVRQPKQARHVLLLNIHTPERS